METIFFYGKHQFEKVLHTFWVKKTLFITAGSTLVQFVI